LQSEKVKLPKWVQLPEQKSKSIKNLEKLRKNRPAEEPATEASEETAPAEAETTSEA
jgi:hypothetical protein